jgi:hypothetical protein
MNIKTPISPVGWLVATILILILFPIYYTGIYGAISDQYQMMYWYSTQYREQTKSVFLRVYVPQYVADFVSREIRVVAWNETDTSSTLDLIVKSSVYDAKSELQNKQCPQIEMNQPFVYVILEPDNADEKSSAKQGTSEVLLTIPPRGSSTANFLVNVQPSVSAVDGSCISLQFLQTNDNNKIPTLVNFENSSDGQFVVQFDRGRTFWASFISTLLLPPWSNAFIPALVLSVVWWVESLMKKPGDKKENGQ